MVMLQSDKHGKGVTDIQVTFVVIAVASALVYSMFLHGSRVGSKATVGYWS